MSDGAFTGKVVLVTGGSRGIGRATALAFAREGAEVTIVYRERDGLAAAVVQEIAAAGGRAHAERADVRSEEDVARAVRAIAARHGALHALVNNAGAIEPARTDALDLAGWRDGLDANLTSVFVVTRACLPLLRAARGAAIVNVSSVAGVRGGTIGPHYAAAKGGVIALTKYWARELLPDAIRVNAVAPSMTDTDLAAAVWPGEARTRMQAATPMHRYAEPGEVADAIVYLAGARAGYVTGECLNVTGGF